VILIAGGGLAGAAAGVALAQAGRAVTLIERQAGPVDKICGEFLSGEAASSLRALGLEPAALGGARISHVRLVRGARSVRARLPFLGLGLSRRVLDEALLAHAAQAGVQVRRGCAIRQVEPDLTLALDGGERVAAEILLLATGKHEARGAARAAVPGRMVGFKSYFRLRPGQQAALAGHVELVMFPGGYAGLQMVEGQAANLCALVTAPRLKRLGGSWAGLLDHMRQSSPHLAARLEGAEDLRETPLTIARVPYGFVHKAAGPAGLFRLGDQAAVIPSFTGDGMAIALHSAALAARHVIDGRDASAYHARLRADVAGQINRAGALLGLLGNPVSGPVAFTLAQAWPAALAMGAALTRVPEERRV